MDRRPLPPEACLDLKIHLDNLRSTEERCLEGLQRLISGDLSRADYLGLLDRQMHAQRAWERRHRAYFEDPGGAEA